ncbi:MAG: ABC transporter substrate-binding protein [Paracoccaceae bacterium]|nr:MAG: ABC transporter substrate-binding protein [Paracoccaceae bacterium]
MKKLLLASAATLGLAAGAAQAQDIKLGIILGFTGPLESLTPQMAQGAELAIAEINAAGGILGGQTATGVRADSTCVDAAAATAAAERLITSDRVNAIMGADCSGVTNAILQNVARPNGVLMISPSATSPGLTTAETDGLFFRTSPSDARQGVVMTENIMDRGIKTVAVTYTNNDYGKGLADSFQAAFEAAGGKVTINAAHEDGKADYSAEVAALAAAGGDALVLAGYIDQGGGGVLRASLDSGAFSTFVFPDGMVSQALEDRFGAEINGSFGQNPASSAEGAGIFHEMAKAGGFDGTSPFSAESYDAAALILMAMEASGSTDSKVFKDKILELGNAPGEPIQPGELGKALEIIRSGGDIDYQGATNVEFVNGREAAGSYREIEFKDGKLAVVRYR